MAMLRSSSKKGLVAHLKWALLGSSNWRFGKMPMVNNVETIHWYFMDIHWFHSKYVFLHCAVLKAAISQWNSKVHLLQTFKFISTRSFYKAFFTLLLAAGNLYESLQEWLEWMLRQESRACGDWLKVERIWKHGGLLQIWPWHCMVLFLSSKFGF